MLVKLTSTLLKTGQFKSEQIGDIPHLIEEQKNVVLQETNATPVLIKIDKVNYNQTLAFNIIKSIVDQRHVLER